MLKLNEKYKKEVVPQMMAKFGYKNVMAVPKIKKVVINTGYGREATSRTGDEQKKAIEFILKEISLISGQKAVKTYAKKAIAGFKVRKGIPIGAKVTLRRGRMSDFLERLIHISFPRIRDFNGISINSIDKQGNLTVAVKEHIIFSEIYSEKIKDIFGLEITIVTGAKTKEEAIELFKLLGFPIRR